MKQCMLIISIMLIASLGFAKEPAQPKAKSPYAPAKEINVPHALLRGTANLFTFWMEVPRELIVENNLNPIYGLVTGLVKGTYYAGARLVYTTLDFAFLGFTGPSGYDSKFTEYVWDSQWNPWPEKKKVTSVKK